MNRKKTNLEEWYNNRRRQEHGKQINEKNKNPILTRQEEKKQNIRKQLKKANSIEQKLEIIIKYLGLDDEE